MVDTDVTVLIPYTPEHNRIASNAIASVEQQTYPTEYIAMPDLDYQGAGWTRNRLLTSVTTDYVLFLDADDWLEPEAVERMRRAIIPGRYVYSDWYVNDRHQHAPDKAWCQGGTWHCITSLCRTDDVMRVGGFDEQLEALEDTDFWLKMNFDGVCGLRVPYPLFHYSGNGQRSLQAKQSGRDTQIKRLLVERYGGVPVGCCGQAEIVDTRPQGEKQDGDVLAMALWHGNHTKRGKTTGRRYPRMSWPKTTWVSPFDVQRDKMSWRLVQNGKEEVNEKQYVGAGGFAEAMIEAGVITPPPEPPPLGDMPADYELLNGHINEAVYQPPLGKIAPDWDTLVALGAQRYE
jgi:hypothetical protein